MSKKRNIFLFFLMTAAATILRVYKIGTNYYFSGELGKELLYVRQLISQKQFPLVGLPTSHVWLNYGPVYYWILIPLIKIFGSFPYILFWLALSVSIIGILITYFVFAKIVDKKYSLILSFFVSVSPLWIWMTRLSKLHTFFFILIPACIYFLYKIWLKEKRFMLWLGVAFGLLFSFHYSQIPQILIILGVFWLRRKNLKFRDYLKFVIGLIIPNITILIYDVGQKFSMVRNLILWIPYRFAGFIGLYPKNNLDIASGTGTLAGFNEFFGRNLFWDSRFWIMGSAIFLILFVGFVIQNHEKFTKDFFTFYLILSTLVQCVALLIHTSPPVHYFLPIFLNFGLLFSYYTHQNWDRKSTKILTVIIFVLLFASTIFEFRNEHAADSDYIPLKTQEAVANYIVKDAKGAPFNLDRIGPYDYFPEYYDQAYQFLILENGGKIDSSVKLRYTIYDTSGVFVFKNE